MSSKVLYSLWGVLFIICAALGFIPEPAGTAKTLMTVLSVVFFLPPAALLYRADRNTVKLVRNLSLASLVLTLVVLVLNLLSALQAEFLGNVLHALLIIISTPMVCSGYWVLSLFLWACLLMVSLQLLRNR